MRAGNPGNAIGFLFHILAPIFLPTLCFESTSVVARRKVSDFPLLFNYFFPNHPHLNHAKNQFKLKRANYTISLGRSARRFVCFLWNFEIGNCR